MTKFDDIDAAVTRARGAMAQIENATENEINEIVRAIGWAIYRDDHARTLAEMAVADTGLGNVADKVIKNKRKTYGTLCDLLATRTRGLVQSAPARGLFTYLKPVGVVGALTPSTNPAATPANQAMMAIKGGNAIIISPSPAGARCARSLEGFIGEALTSIGAPTDLFQVLNGPINLDRATYLSQVVDLVLVTGDQTNVRRGYSSGTPCIGVGKGNVPVIIDASADLADAARKVASSKTFDNATSCSSENALIVLDSIYEETIDKLEEFGGYMADRQQAKRIADTLFKDGKVNRSAVGKSIGALDTLFELGGCTDGKRFVMVEENGIGPSAPLSGEKLSLVLTIYRAPDLDAAMTICEQILDYEGIGHSVGIHTSDETAPHALALRMKAARVLVNQAHTFGNGGGVDNALPFTLTMGCGTWAGNSISDNLSIENFVNKTVLVKTFDKSTPDRADSFAGFYDPSLDV